MKNEMKITHQDGRCIGEFQQMPYERFSYCGRSMLINRETGTTLFLTDALADRIEAGELSDEMKYKFISRGFAKVPGSPEIAARCDQVLPRFFLIDLTNACNMACRYCLRVPEQESTCITEEMTGKICEYIYTYCRKYGIRNIAIQPWGGEPLLAMERILQIRRYFDQCPELRADICVETNGLLLTEANVRKLQQYRIRASVSLDGPKAIQDQQRPDRKGESTSERIRQNMLRATELGLGEFGGICILTDHSLGKIHDILHYFAYELPMQSIKLNLMRQPAYTCEGVRALEPEEIEQIAIEIVEELSQLRRSGARLREATTEDRLHNLTTRKNTNICNSRGCCGGKQMVSFDSQGNIYPCELTDWTDECMGNIADDRDLCELVREAMRSKPYFRKKHAEECDTCPWWGYCKGGCSSSIKYKGTHRTSIDETECALNKTLYPILVKKLLSGEVEEERWL